jgi:Asp-tRNA(Asn)/Glu-tRNA(Gln) amidotransferase B subunit
MEYKTLQTNFERELLFQIIQNIKRKKLTKKNAKKVAKAFVPTLTSEDADTFIEKNARLCEFYPEIMEAFLVTIKDYEQYVVRSGLSKVRTEMKGGGKNGNN